MAKTFAADGWSLESVTEQGSQISISHLPGGRVYSSDAD